jgi:hypothetical protein
MKNQNRKREKKKLVGATAGHMLAVISSVTM